MTHDRITVTSPKSLLDLEFTLFAFEGLKTLMNGDEIDPRGREGVTILIALLTDTFSRQLDALRAELSTTNPQKGGN